MPGAVSLEVDVAVLRTRQDAHDKHCDERSERTAQDISAMRTTTERESRERRDAVSRIHERIDSVDRTGSETKSLVEQVQAEVANVQAEVAKLPSTIATEIAREIANAKKDSQLWLYSKIGAAVIAAGSLLGLVLKALGKG